MKSPHISFSAKRAARILTSLLPGLNFITLHYAYFIITIVVSSIIFWKTSTTEPSVSYVNSLFMVASAMTLTGLAAVNLSSLNTFQQTHIFILMIAGNYTIVGYIVILVRKHAFESRLTQITENYHQQRQQSGSSFSFGSRSFHLLGRFRSRSTNTKNDDVLQRDDGLQSRVDPVSPRSKGARNGETFDVESRYSVHWQPSDLSDDRDHNWRRRKSESAVLSVFRLGAMISGMNPETHSETIFAEIPSRRDNCPHWLVETQANNKPLGAGREVTCSSIPRLDGNHDRIGEHIPRVDTGDRNLINEILERAVVGHNSQFHGLRRQDHITLGGVEYRAIRLLSFVVPLYLVVFQGLGCLSTALYVGFRGKNQAGLNAVNSWWLGIFLGVSSFSNTGLSLLDSGMSPFSKNSYLLLTMSFLIMAGNIAYPIFLRFILWLAYHSLPSHKAPQLKETLGFLLAYPRRVYTNLFPAAHTWWLFFALIVLSGIDWISFEVLNRHNSLISSMSNPFRQEVGFFQSISIRSAGFNIISVSSLAVGTQFLTVIMMYISIFPVLIPLRSSNVYEERSLGVYADAIKTIKDPETQQLNEKSSMSGSSIKKTRWYFLQQHVRSQLAHDLWWLTIAILVIVCVEVSSYNDDPKTYAIFNVIFEVVSAYGPVGLSTGLPHQAYALSGGFHKVSKLVIIATMVRGRHRGLPVAIDRAVVLPGERLGQREDEDSRIRGNAADQIKHEGERAVLGGEGIHASMF